MILVLLAKPGKFPECRTINKLYAQPGLLEEQQQQKSREGGSEI